VYFLNKYPVYHLHMIPDYVSIIY